MKIIDEKNIDPIDEMTQIAQDILDLSRRGFTESYTSGKPIKLIYNSEYCRISLGWKGWDYLGGNSIRIVYGRLHAQNEKTTMIWNDEQCYCWHTCDYALHFLDGQAPRKAAALGSSHVITDPFYEEEFRQRFHRRQPYWLAQMQVTIWQQYGQRLFDLFDLRQPELWQQYRQFLKEVYDIKGRPDDIEPPMDQVC